MRCGRPGVDRPSGLERMTSRQCRLALLRTPPKAPMKAKTIRRPNGLHFKDLLFLFSLANMLHSPQANRTASLGTTDPSFVTWETQRFSALIALGAFGHQLIQSFIESRSLEVTPSSSWRNSRKRTAVWWS